MPRRKGFRWSLDCPAPASCARPQAPGPGIWPRAPFGPALCLGLPTVALACAISVGKDSRRDFARCQAVPPGGSGQPCDAGSKTVRG